MVRILGAQLDVLLAVLHAIAHIKNGKFYVHFDLYVVELSADAFVSNRTPMVVENRVVLADALPRVDMDFA